MLTRLALAAIHFYQRHLRHAGLAAVLVALAIILALGAVEVIGLPYLLVVAAYTPAPFGPLLAIAVVILAIILGAVIAVAGLAMGAPFSSCRYTPSCSNYGLIAYGRFGILWGSLLTAWRPWGGHGWDPVPERKDGRPDRPGLPRQLAPDKKHPHGQVLPPKIAG